MRCWRRCRRRRRRWVLWLLATYSVYAKAVDAAGNRSYRTGFTSFTVTGEIVDIERPSVPGALVVGSIGADSVSFTWAPATDNVGVTGYLIFDADTNTVLIETADDRRQLRRSAAWHLPFLHTSGGRRRQPLLPNGHSDRLHPGRFGLRTAFGAGRADHRGHQRAHGRRCPGARRPTTSGWPATGSSTMRIEQSCSRWRPRPVRSTSRRAPISCTPRRSTPPATSPTGPGLRTVTVELAARGGCGQTSQDNLDRRSLG